MNDHKGNIAGTVTTGVFAALSKMAQHFEHHAQSYAALAAIIVAGVTIANIFFGPFSKQRKRKLEDGE